MGKEGKGKEMICRVRVYSKHNAYICAGITLISYRSKRRGQGKKRGERKKNGEKKAANERPLSRSSQRSFDI